MQFPGIILCSEIFQMTGPIRRFATFLAGHGYLVAVPEVYHELEPAGTVLAYDQAGSDKGNSDKYAKKLSAYDDNSRSLLRHMVGMPECNGRLGVVGICLGGHLAFRAAMNPEVRAAVCFYATDIHSGTIGAGKKDDSLARASEIKGELLHIWGRACAVRVSSRSRFMQFANARSSSQVWSSGRFTGYRDPILSPSNFATLGERLSITVRRRSGTAVGTVPVSERGSPASPGGGEANGASELPTISIQPEAGRHDGALSENAPHLNLAVRSFHDAFADG